MSNVFRGYRASEKSRCRAGHFISKENITHMGQGIRIYCEACERHQTLWRAEEKERIRV